MKRSELITTSFDHEDFKQSLIDYLRTTDEFGDFNYEGSAINTIIDLLTRNTVYTSFLANMLANESFIESAQMRGNVSAHAQKLSYLPNSSTASRIVADVRVSPTTTVTDTTPIKSQSGTVFLASVGGRTYSFTTDSVNSYSYSVSEEKFIAKDVDLYQGQYISNSIAYANEPVIIPNKNVDISTLSVQVDDITFNRATSISEFGSEEHVYFLRERTDGLYEIDFGRDVLGIEPSQGASIDIHYINTETEHANGVKNLMAASTIDGYSNISVTVTTPSFGGKDRDDIETIRFMAPKVYQSQDRALSEFDYIPIVKTQFPFIKSVITWGGENNLPPRYGSVFLSLLTDDGTIITDSLARIIEQYIKRKMVGSVIPVVVSPVFFSMVLDVNYKFDRSKSRKTQSEIESYIKDVVFDYSDSVMNEFDSYYNHSELISRIKENNAIESVIIDEKISYNLDVFSGAESSYNINFDNPVVEGTLFADGFVIEANGSEHKLYDDDQGNIIISYNDNGTKTVNVGTIDYEEGSVVIAANFIQDSNTIEVSVIPKDENFYVSRNSVVTISECNTKEITR